MQHLDIALAVIGTMVVATGLSSRLIKRSPIQEPMIAVLVGVVAGPYALG